MSDRIEYCTYFDANYLTRGIALYLSLLRHSPPFRLWVLCFDDEAYEALVRLDAPGLTPIRLEDFERDDLELLAAKAGRSTVEYYFTCTPSLPLYVLRMDPTIETITYLDADLLFYSDPSSLLATGGGRSITIIPHGFPSELKHLAIHGTYNVGLLSFRNDVHGRACLERWRSQCLEWCYDRIEGERFADQGYLNDWPTALDGVVVIDRPGAGLAPWNFMRYRIDFRHQPPLVDGDPLVFYHFQAFKAQGRWLYDLGLVGYGHMPHRLRVALYGAYIDELGVARQLLTARAIQPRSGAPSSRHLVQRRLTSTLRSIARGRTMVAIGRLRL